MSHTYWIRLKMYRPGWCFCRVMKTTGVLPGVRVCLKNAHGFWDNNITTPSVVTPQEHNQHHLLHIWFLVGNFFLPFTSHLLGRVEKRVEEILFQTTSVFTLLLHRRLWCEVGCCCCCYYWDSNFFLELIWHCGPTERK